MGAITSVLGIGPNAQNGGFSTANLQNATTVDQANQAYGQSQAALQAQQQFLQALQAQGGIQNQSNVYNQLQDVASGQGPNPAQAMLANQTGNIAAQQAALMASQRGAGANAGLIARQAAQQGGNLQQNAAGQAAALQAQQSLGALGQLGGIAGQQVGQQANAVQGYNAAAQGQQGMLLNSIQNQNANALANAGLANQGKAAALNAQSGFINALGAAAVQGAMGMPATPKAQNTATPNLGANSGTSQGFNINPDTGAMQMYAEGGEVANSQNSQPMLKENYKGKSRVGKFLSGLMDGQPAKMAEGGQAPVTAQMLANKGAAVPGKAQVKGDSLKNDKVPAILSPKEIVLPRSVTMSKDPAKAAANFVAAIVRKHGGKL